MCDADIEERLTILEAKVSELYKLVSQLNQLTHKLDSENSGFRKIGGASCEKKKSKRSKRDKLRDDVFNDIKKIASDPEFLKRAEELHKKLSYVSYEDMHRPFTI